MNMQTWILLTGVVVAIALALLIFAVIKVRKQAEIRKEHPGYPEGHWMGQGLGIGMAIGAGLGVALGNIAIGVGMGVAIGVAIGSGLEKQHADEIRPPTEAELALTRQSRIVAIVALVIGVVAFAVVYFLAR